MRRLASLVVQAILPECELAAVQSFAQLQTGQLLCQLAIALLVGVVQHLLQFVDSHTFGWDARLIVVSRLIVVASVGAC